MDIVYTITSCTEDEVAVKAIVAGKTVDAKMAGLVVEATSSCGGMGHTFRFTPDDMDAAKAMFAIGAVVTSTFALTTPAHVEEPVAADPAPVTTTF